MLQYHQHNSLCQVPGVRPFTARRSKDSSVHHRSQEFGHSNSLQKDKLHSSSRQWAVQALPETQIRDEEEEEVQLEGISKQYCDDFVCTSSPQVCSSLQPRTVIWKFCTLTWRPKCEASAQHSGFCWRSVSSDDYCFGVSSCMLRLHQSMGSNVDFFKRPLPTEAAKRNSRYCIKVSVRSKTSFLWICILNMNSVSAISA